MSAAPHAHIIATLRRAPAERTQEEVHALVVLLTEQLRSHREGPGANHPGAPGARFWVVLSLQEAESLRGALHIAHGADGAASGALVALHTDGEVLDSLNYAPGSSYERAVVEQSLRLLSAESEYSPRSRATAP